MLKQQFHISISGKDPIVIDLHDDESVSVHIDNRPRKFVKDDSPLTVIRIDGLRWRDDDHFHLGWGNYELEAGEKISIELTSQLERSSQLVIEEQYIVPEKKCTFCQKRASEVEWLVEKNPLARICNECVEICQEEIEKHRAT